MLPANITMISLTDAIRPDSTLTNANAKVHISELIILSLVSKFDPYSLSNLN